jgi:hypothetical protein
MAEDGIVMEDEDRWFRWMGRKTKWVGIETNYLYRGFHRLC